MCSPLPAAAQAVPQTAPALQPRLTPAVVPLGSPYTAELAEPARTAKFAAAGAQWECADRRCRTVAAWPAPTVDACRAVAKSVGRVVSFGSGKTRLTEAQLAECNPARAVAAPSAQPRLAAAARGTAAAAIAGPAVVRRDQYRSLVDLRELAERQAAERATRERVDARNAEAQAFERRRIALGYTERVSGGGDCDDGRREVHPLAGEVCDLQDNDCDGEVDEGQTFRLFLDADGDGHGDPSSPADVCPAEQRRAADEGRWLVPVGNDCDDADPSRWQGCP
jgi:hypothetical protein